MVNFLKRYFAENLITQQEIESKTRISQSKISLTLNNKRKLTAEELLKIAISFDINLEELKKDIKLAWETQLNINNSQYESKKSYQNNSPKSLKLD